MLSDKITKKRAFTLIELMVAIGISTIFMAGLATFFTLMTNSFLSAQYINKTYDSFNDFEEIYASLKTKYNVELSETWTVFSNDNYWFKTVAFTNSGQTDGFIIGSYDYIQKKVVIGKTNAYSDFVPFLYKFNNSEFDSVKNDLWNHIQGIDSTRFTFYPKINLFKLWYSNLNDGTYWRLELILTAEYYTDYHWSKYTDLFKSSAFTPFHISIVK